MNDILKAIVTAAQTMSPLEIAANLTFAASVILCNFRRWENYLLGVVGTICFFFVFWHAKLFSLALLQVWLTGVQLYGLWYWVRGNKGSSPPITRATGGWWLIAFVFTSITTFALSEVTSRLGAPMAVADAALFSLSVVAQFFLDRKKLENWLIWFAINTISIPLFWSQGLYLTAIIYAGFWVNAIIAYHMWRKEYRSYSPVPIVLHGLDVEEELKISPTLDALRGEPVTHDERAIDALLSDAEIDRVTTSRTLNRTGPGQH